MKKFLALLAVSALLLMPACSMVSASGQQSGSQQISISVAAPTLVITTTVCPDATVGVAYSCQVAVTGGTAPYTYAVTTGTLPAGLSLDGSTGLISGTPTTSGTSTFTVTVTDSSK